MGKYKAICFDVDGTLYPEDTLHKLMAPFIIFHPALNKKYSVMRKTFRLYQDKFEQLGLAKASMFDKQVAMMAKAVNVSEQKAKKLVAKYYDILERTYKRLGTVKNSASTLKKLKEKGYKVGVFSDWPLYDKLKRLGVEQYVDYAASSDDIGMLKPNFKCFEYLLYNLKVKPNETLYVGDSYSKDIVGAADAGMDAVLIGCNPSAQYDKAYKVFEDWKSFENWILTLEEK